MFRSFFLIYVESHKDVASLHITTYHELGTTEVIEVSP